MIDARRPQARRERRAPPRRRCSRARARSRAVVLAQVGLADVDRDAVVGRVPLASPRPPAGRSRTQQGRSRASRPRSRARRSRSRCRARCPAPRPRAARDRAASSDARRCRRRGPGSITTAIASPSGSSQGGPIQSRPTRTGWWNCAPAILPVLLDVGDRRTAERLPDPLLAGRVRVRRDLEPADALDLLEAFREELEHDGTRLLGSRGGDGRPRRA